MRVLDAPGDVLFSITYVSRWLVPNNEPDAARQFENALWRWDRANAANQISSHLWMTNKAVFQTLEGPQSRVEQVLDKMQHDDRHDMVSVMAAVPCPARLYKLGLTFLRIPPTEDSLPCHQLLDHLGVQYRILWRFCPPAVRPRLLAGQNAALEPPTQLESSFVVAIRLLGFDCFMQSLPKRRDGVRNSTDLVRFVNSFTAMCLPLLERLHGEVLGMRGTTVYAIFAGPDPAVAVEAACTVLKHIQSARLLANLRDVDCLLHATAAVAGARMVSGYLTPGACRAQRTAAGGGITLCNWLLDYCMPLGAGILLTESVAGAMPDLDTRTLGAHHLGKGLAGELPSAPKGMKVRLYTLVRDTFPLPANFPKEVDSFWHRWAQEENRAAREQAEADKKLWGITPEEYWASKGKRVLPPAKAKAVPAATVVIAPAAPPPPVDALEPEPPHWSEEWVLKWTEKTAGPPKKDWWLEEEERERSEHLPHDTVGLPVAENELRRLWERLGGGEQQKGTIPLLDVQQFYRMYDVLDGEDFQQAVRRIRNAIGILKGPEVDYQEFSVLMLKLARQ
mmetsp:Transcript_153685/g.268806  ORF Transcript_153685/g.268806 Transcript_153685/m.268806 type:complete len:564 (-) Transcript_153685:109-1800(-)